MSDIEKEKFRQIGIDLINEYRVRGGFKPINSLAVMTPEASAFIRSIQLHEKTKQELQGVKQELADFRQEVSDVVWDYYGGKHIPRTSMFAKFAIPKPDPLVAVLEKMGWYIAPNGPTDAENFRAALGALGFEIREKNDG